MMSKTRRNRLAPPLVLSIAVMALAASGCAAQFDRLPEQLGGLPAGAPQRPATMPPTPNVYEVRPTREVRPLTDDEQKRLESELATLRESQKQRANPPPPPKKAAAPGKKVASPDAKAAKPAPARKKADAPVVPAAKQPSGPMKLIN